MPLNRVAAKAVLTLMLVLTLTHVCTWVPAFDSAFNVAIVFTGTYRGSGGRAGFLNIALKFILNPSLTHRK